MNLYVTSRAFTDARNLFLLWDVMIYCAKNEIDVPMQYIDIALSAAVANPDASLMTKAIAWLEEYDLMLLFNIANVDVNITFVYCAVLPVTICFLLLPTNHVLVGSLLLRRVRTSI